MHRTRTRASVDSGHITSHVRMAALSGLNTLTKHTDNNAQLPESIFAFGEAGPHTSASFGQIVPAEQSPGLFSTSNEHHNVYRSTKPLTLTDLDELFVSSKPGMHIWNVDPRRWWDVICRMGIDPNLRERLKKEYEDITGRVLEFSAIQMELLHLWVNAAVFCPARISQKAAIIESSLLDLEGQTVLTVEELDDYMSIFFYIRTVIKELSPLDATKPFEAKVGWCGIDDKILVEALAKKCPPYDDNMYEFEKLRKEIIEMFVVSRNTDDIVPYLLQLQLSLTKIKKPGNDVEPEIALAAACIDGIILFIDDLCDRVHSQVTLHDFHRLQDTRKMYTDIYDLLRPTTSLENNTRILSHQSTFVDSASEDKFLRSILSSEALNNLNKDTVLFARVCTPFFELFQQLEVMRTGDAVPSISAMRDLHDKMKRKMLTASIEYSMINDQPLLYQPRQVLQWLISVNPHVPNQQHHRSQWYPEDVELKLKPFDYADRKALECIETHYIEAKM